LVEEAMGNFHRYFFIMPTLARFELAIHERAEKGLPLTADIMIGLLADLFAEGYGDEVEMDRERVGITWAQFSTHLYMNFYVYQYATGISGAHALAKRVLDGVSGAAEAYLVFLKAGGSDYQLNILKKAGVGAGGAGAGGGVGGGVCGGGGGCGGGARPALRGGGGGAAGPRGGGGGGGGGWGGGGGRGWGGWGCAMLASGPPAAVGPGTE